MPENGEDETYIRSQKVKQNEVELEQIHNIFMEILQDIRKSAEQQDPASQKLTRQIWQEVAALIAGSIGTTGVLDDERVRKLQEVALQMLSSIGKQQEQK